MRKQNTTEFYGMLVGKLDLLPAKMRIEEAGRLKTGLLFSFNTS